jgi:hypothetical protein
MPGTPDPVLGSDALTFAVALLGAAVVVGFLVLLERRGRLHEPHWSALAVGAAYGIGSTLLWAGVLAVFAPRLLPDSGAWLVALAPVVVGLQAAVPVYGYARWRLVAPMAALVPLTMLVFWLVLRVGGESDGYLLYVFLGSAYALPGLLVLTGIELGARELRRRLANDPDDGS